MSVVLSHGLKYRCGGLRAVQSRRHSRFLQELRNRSGESTSLPGEGALAALLADQPPLREGLAPGLGDRVRVARIGLVVARDDQRGHIEVLQVLEAVEGKRARNLAQSLRDRIWMVMPLHPVPGDPQSRLPPFLGGAQ